MNHPEPPASRAAFHAALAALQAELTPATTLAEALALLPRHGLSWCLLPGDVDDCHELRLCHAEGHQLATFADRADLPLAFAGLIGMPAALITTELLIRFDPSVDDDQEPPATEADPAPEPPAASPALATAAASLAEATGGSVVEEDEPAEDPSHSTELLSEADRLTTLDLVKAMAPETRKAFTVAFRDAFNVPREARAVAPLILEERHRQFACRFVDEAEGIAAP